MRILYVTTVGMTMIFFKDIVRELIDEGNTVDIATNEDEFKVDDVYREMGCDIFQIGFSRSPADFGNIKAYKTLKKLISEKHYDIVHCHTPVASVITRLACRKLRKNGLKVIYTAHGFHFYKGAPLKNWLIYYPAEKLCSRFTDVLITINHEDYEFARKKMKAKRVEYVPGVGVDVGRFADTVVDRAEKRRELGIPENAFLMISVGELNENKNHQIVIRALAELKNPDVHYMIAGKGPLGEDLLTLAGKLDIEKQVHLLGFREDVAELYKVSDVDVFPSRREGLGLAAVEGMSSGLPLICSDNRGTREYAVSGCNAIVCENSQDEYLFAIGTLYQHGETRTEYGNNAKITAQRFDVRNVNEAMKKIYKDNLTASFVKSGGQNMNYFVYVNKLIGVETNLSCFNWNFGASAPKTTYQEYSQCLIKIKLTVCKEKDVFPEAKKQELKYRFRHFSAGENEIGFSQKLGFINFRYWMSIRDNSIDIRVGKNYYRWVKYKIMNVHPIWYVLYDAVSCLLLKNGLTVLYGAAAETEDKGATVFMGAPGVGKTSIAINLCRSKRLKLISEDFLITDGERVWSAPYTNTYRADCSSDGISFVKDAIPIKKAVILEQGNDGGAVSNEILLQKAKLLNRYGVQYYNSPAMMVFDYFNPDFSLDSFLETGNQILEKVFGGCDCFSLRSDDPSSFLQKYLDKIDSLR